MLGRLPQGAMSRSFGRIADIQLPKSLRRRVLSAFASAVGADLSEVAADLEGMAILSDDELILVSDNDFGVEGAETSFWRLRFDAPVLA